MGLRRVKTIDEMRTLLAGMPLECRALDRASVCELLEWTLRQFLMRFTGLSEAQLDRSACGSSWTRGVRATCAGGTAGGRSGGRARVANVRRRTSPMRSN